MKILATFSTDKFFGEITPIRTTQCLLNFILDKPLGEEVLIDEGVVASDPNTYDESKLLNIIKHYDCITRHTEIHLVSNRSELLALSNIERYQQLAKLFIDNNNL